MIADSWVADSGGCDWKKGWRVVGGWSKGRAWVCSVQALLKQETDPRGRRAHFYKFYSIFYKFLKTNRIFSDFYCAKPYGAIYYYRSASDFHGAQQNFSKGLNVWEGDSLWHCDLDLRSPRDLWLSPEILLKIHFSRVRHFLRLKCK